MILALVLSTLAWVVAVEDENPTRTGRFPQPIPVDLIGLPPDMILLESLEGSARVTLRATASVWANLSASDFEATADLTGLGPGVHRVSVDVRLEKTPSRIVQIEPEAITVELDVSTERTIPVEVDVEGEPALGYLRRAPAVSPQEVTVSGPQTYVSQVVRAWTEVSIQDTTDDLEGDFPLRPQDAQGQLVSKVSLFPDVVYVRVPIELSNYYRPLPVKVVITGTVTTNYRVTDISVEPPTITIFGSPDTISALPGFVETEPINVEGAEADVVARPSLNLPTNVAVVAGQQPVVRVSVDPIVSSRTVEVTPVLQGLSPGLTATVPLQTMEVILSGPLPMLEALEPDDVRVVLDLFGLPVGTHQVEPLVIVPEGITAQNVLPATLQIEISVATAPTPSTTITPTLTLEPTAVLTD
jgi:YbbR domain-containing protein